MGKLLSQEDLGFPVSNNLNYSSEGPNQPQQPELNLEPHHS